MRRLTGKDIPTEESTSVQYTNREIDKKLFEILVSYLEKAIFAKKEFFLVTDLNTSFHHLLTKFGEEDFDTVGLTTQKLEE